MPRIAIAQIIRECTACGEPATAGRYCHKCEPNSRPVYDFNGRVIVDLIEQGGGHA